jgi:hypothetical protein
MQVVAEIVGVNPKKTGQFCCAHLGKRELPPGCRQAARYRRA